MKRLLQFGLIATLLAFTALAIPATSKSVVHAATVTPHTDTNHCASLGSLLETDPLISQGVTLGYLKIYYNSANGYNCAETVSSSSTYGKSKTMYVQLIVCTQTSPSAICTPKGNSPPNSDDDMGTYSYYAGPVGVYGAGHCIRGFASIRGDGYYDLYSTDAVHCG